MHGTNMKKYIYGNYGKEFIYALKYPFTDPIFTGLKPLDNVLKKNSYTEFHKNATKLCGRWN